MNRSVKKTRFTMLKWELKYDVDFISQIFYYIFHNERINSQFYKNKVRSLKVLKMLEKKMINMVDKTCSEPILKH